MDMAGLSLNVLTENASRLGARIQESLHEHTKDLGVKDYFDAPEEKIKQIRTQLDSNSDREKIDGLKRLVAVRYLLSLRLTQSILKCSRKLISKGRNVSEFFPYVVKNVASPNLEIRKLVYIFLLRYAHAEPDLALLSINSFQRDLADPNPLIRAMALRVLSGINVPMVANIVVMAIRKCAADVSPYVRKAAALALVKCYQYVFYDSLGCTMLLTPLMYGSFPVTYTHPDPYLPTRFTCEFGPFGAQCWPGRPCPSYHRTHSFGPLAPPLPPFSTFTCRC